MVRLADGILYSQGKVSKLSLDRNPSRPWSCYRYSNKDKNVIVHMRN